MTVKKILKMSVLKSVPRTLENWASKYFKKKTCFKRKTWPLLRTDHSFDYFIQSSKISFYLTMFFSKALAQSWPKKYIWNQIKESDLSLRKQAACICNGYYRNHWKHKFLVKVPILSPCQVDCEASKTKYFQRISK